MSQVAVSAGQVMPYVGSETDFLMRIFAKKTFVDSDLITVLGSDEHPDEIYLEVPCTVSGGYITHDAFDITSTTDALADPKHTSYRFELYLTSGDYYCQVWKRIIVPDTPNPTTLGAIVAYSTAHFPVREYTYTASQIDAMFANLVNMATKATELIYGAVRLSVPADLISDPVVVGDNDPRLVAAAMGDPETVIFRSNYASLALAKAAALNKELCSNTADAITSSTTIDRFTKVSTRGQGQWSVSAGQDLTVYDLLDPGDRMLNIGAGELIINNTPHLRQAWWTGRHGGTTYCTANVDASQTTIQVADSTVFGPAGGYICIEREWMKVVTNDPGSPTQLIVQRGADGTSAVTHIATTTLAEDIDEAPQAPGDETIWTVADGAAFGLAPFFAQVDSEIVKVTGIVGNDWYVIRNISGGAAVHSNGATIHKRPEVLAAISSTMQSGIVTSLTNAGGVRLIQAPGKWATHGGWDLPIGTIIDGASGQVDGASGTIWRLKADNTYLFKIGDGISAVTFNDVTFELLGTTGSDGVRMAGPTGGASRNVSFNRCRFNDGDYGVNIYDTLAGATWMMLGVTFQQCHFISQEIACFRTNTSNGSMYFEQCDMTPRPNEASYCGIHDYSGPAMYVNCSFNGVNVTPQCIHTNISSIDLATNIVTTAADHQLTVGQLYQVTIYNATPANLPAGTTNINRTTGEDVFSASEVDKLELWALPTSSTELKCYLNRQWAWLGDEINYRFNFTSSGTGTHQLRTNRPVTDDRPAGVLLLKNTFTGIYVSNSQDEGFPYWCVVDSHFEKQRPVVFKNNIIQSLIYLKAQVLIKSEDNWMYANAFTEQRTSGNAPEAIIYSNGDQIVYDGVLGGYKDMGNTVKSATRMTLDGFAGYSKVVNQEVPESLRAVKNVPHLFTLEDHQAPVDPMVEIAMPRYTAETVPFRIGLREAWSDGGRCLPNKYYDWMYLDSTPAPTYAWMVDYLELRCNAVNIATKQNGLYVNGSLAMRGVYRNLKSVQLTPTTGTVTIDLSEGNVFYFSSLTGDVTINVDTTLGNEGVPSQPIEIWIPASTTNYTVAFNNGCFGPGRKSFNTGKIAGDWLVSGRVWGGNNLYIYDRQLMTASGVAADQKNQPPVYASGSPELMVVGMTYYTNNGSQRTLKLPEFSNIGDKVRIVTTNGGGYKVSQFASQYIVGGYVSATGTAGVNQTTTGTGGYIESVIEMRGFIVLECIEANNGWQITDGRGMVNFV